MRSVTDLDQARRSQQAEAVWHQAGRMTAPEVTADDVLAVVSDLLHEGPLATLEATSGPGGPAGEPSRPASGGHLPGGSS